MSTETEARVVASGIVIVTAFVTLLPILTDPRLTGWEIAVLAHTMALAQKYAMTLDFRMPEFYTEIELWL